MARSSAQSAQRYPLTTILGTEANVRLLRELSRHGGLLSAPSLAARSGLARGSVWTALGTLERIGIVTSEGSARTRLHRIRDDHPLAAPLGALFEAEEARFTAIREAVRSAASATGPGVLAVWIYGSLARGEDRPDSDLDVAVVADPDGLDRIVQATRDALVAPGATLGFVPCVVGLSLDDIIRLARERDPWWTGVATDAVVLSGASPGELATRTRRRRSAA